MFGLLEILALFFQIIFRAGVDIVFLCATNIAVSIIIYSIFNLNFYAYETDVSLPYGIDVVFNFFFLQTS